MIANKRTTCLPKFMERSAFYATAWKLGRYYRTYPAYVEDEVIAGLNDAGQFLRPRNTKRGIAGDHRHAFVVQGYYVSARWPGDAYLFARAIRRTPHRRRATRSRGTFKTPISIA